MRAAKVPLGLRKDKVANNGGRRPRSFRMATATQCSQRAFTLS